MVVIFTNTNTNIFSLHQVLKQMTLIDSYIQYLEKEIGRYKNVNVFNHKEHFLSSQIFLL